ncbi:MAG: anthranilate synthase component I family protein [Saprospiraceae bacterium]
MRQKASFTIHDLQFWRRQLHHWAASQDVCMVLDSHHYEEGLMCHDWELLLGAGCHEILELPVGDAFTSLKKWQNDIKDWMFGGFGYDLKNEIENLQSAHPDSIGFPDLVFFRPEIVIGIRDGSMIIESLTKSPEEVFAQVYNFSIPKRKEINPVSRLQPRLSKTFYFDIIDKIRWHIIEGDLYEMNFCQEFYAEEALLEPMAVWEDLNELAKPPFAAFFRLRDKYILSASPERFLKKSGDTLISQPIKGTRPRSASHDELLREQLYNSEKDRAENVMIVDLVRNDLARSSVAGSVKVPELFGIYTFETVHQMISTVESQLRPEVHPIDAIRNAFPPGSMTGAPKVMAMELIECYEKTRRGFYAGSLGYFSPAGDFDFNVVIRSVFYNETNRSVSVQVGGAVVFDSTAETEYDECLVKAKALFEVLSKIK